MFNKDGNIPDVEWLAGCGNLDLNFMFFHVSVFVYTVSIIKKLQANVWMCRAR